MAEEIYWTCIVRQKTDGKELRHLVRRRSPQYAGPLEKVQAYWRNNKISQEYEELWWLTITEFDQAIEKIGGDCIDFPAAWEELVKQHLRTQEQQATKKRDFDRGPFYWELRDNQGNLRIKPDDAMAAVRAFCADPNRVSKT